MKDARKTKTQLVAELAQLRVQLTEARHRIDELESAGRGDALRQQVEASLRASVEQWYTTFNMMSDAICLIDPQGRIERCNRAMVWLLDKPLSEILGHYCWEVVHGTDKPIDGCPVERMWESLRRESMAVLLGDRWFEVTVAPLSTDDSHNVGAVHVMTDISKRVHSEQERAKAEEALRQSEEKYRQLFERSNDAIFVHDLDGHIFDANSRACEMLGHSRQRLISMRITDLHTDDTLSAARKALGTAKETGEIRFESQLKAADGSIVDVEISAWVIDSETGLTQGIVRDITARGREPSATLRTAPST
jgi:PAS domain S-box-containing protein